MGNLVKIKGMRDGILIKLDDKAEFNDVYNDLCDKFRESSNYFKDASLIIGFDGRNLTPDEEQKLLDGISLNSDVNILCLISDDEENNKRFVRAKSQFDKFNNYEDKQFHRGSVRAHERLETDQSIIILGDVNAGGVVKSKGNIIILGTLYGTAHAGISGNTNSFVFSLDMKSARVGVAEALSEVQFKSSIFQKNKVCPRISYLAGRDVITEEITPELLNIIATQLY